MRSSVCFHRFRRHHLQISGSFGTTVYAGPLNGGSFSGSFVASLPIPSGGETISSYDIELFDSSHALLDTLTGASAHAAIHSSIAIRAPPSGRAICLNLMPRTDRLWRSRPLWGLRADRCFRGIACCRVRLGLLPGTKRTRLEPTASSVQGALIQSRNLRRYCCSPQRRVLPSGLHGIGGSNNPLIGGEDANATMCRVFPVRLLPARFLAAH